MLMMMMMGHQVDAIKTSSTHLINTSYMIDCHSLWGHFDLVCYQSLQSTLYIQHRHSHSRPTQTESLVQSSVQAPIRLLLGLVVAVQYFQDETNSISSYNNII